MPSGLPLSRDDEHITTAQAGLCGWHVDPMERGNGQAAVSFGIEEKQRANM